MQAYKVDASAAGGALDVLGNFNIDTSATADTSYRRMLPGLTLRARPRRLRRGKRTAVRFTVRDAGDAVKGATVKAAGKVGHDGPNGRVTLTINARRPVAARATHRATRARQSGSGARLSCCRGASSLDVMVQRHGHLL